MASNNESNNNNDKPKVDEIIQQEEKSKFEGDYVHKIYDKIAEHFSNTRYKGWPSVLAFLKSESDDAITNNAYYFVCDVGCGNGKYLTPLPGCKDNTPEGSVIYEQSLKGTRLCMIGSDRSYNLLKICQERSFEVQQADNLELPYLSNFFDICISIAVIHHLSTPERRMEAISELFRVVSSGGRIFIQVWAFEQEKKKYLEQDVFVPWHLNAPKSKPKQQQSKGRGKAKQNQVITIDQPIDNNHNGDQIVPKEDPPVFLRYYHMFKKGELEALIEEASKVYSFSFEVLTSAYEKDNWYCIVRKL